MTSDNNTQGVYCFIRHIKKQSLKGELSGRVAPFFIKPSEIITGALSFSKQTNLLELSYAIREAILQKGN
jgi:hypothetical protein